MGRSIEAGEPVPVPADAPPTRCDALQTRLVSPLTLAALRERGARGVAVSEDEIAAAMAFAARHLRLVVEPGGAVALAAVLTGRAGALTERSVVVISGGNVDPLVYAEILKAQATERSGNPAGRHGPARSLDLPGQLLELEPDRPQLGRIGLGVDSRPVQSGGVEQGVEHHRDARQDRFLDPLERLVEAVCCGPAAPCRQTKSFRLNRG